jgi:hypothetical protein
VNPLQTAGYLPLLRFFAEKRFIAVHVIKHLPGVVADVRRLDDRPVQRPTFGFR